MMDSFYSGFEWMDRQIPEGIPFPSSTIITGPGGAGKPLVGAMIVDAWLKRGGTLIHLLINFNREYADKLLEYFNRDIKKYNDRIAYIEFDPLMNGVEKTGFNTIRANLLESENFDLSIRTAEAILPASDSYPLIYGSALNMLLFSKTYGQLIHKKILALLNNNHNTLFTISNNIFEEQVAKWEKAADNLIFSHGTGIMHLALKILKMKSVSFKKNEVEVPISEDELNSIRSEAEKARKHFIPMIRKI